MSLYVDTSALLKRYIDEEIAQLDGAIEQPTSACTAVAEPPRACKACRGSAGSWRSPW